MMILMAWVEINAQKHESFSHLSVNDGLSQSTIFAINQDSKGFMWFGTRGGGLNTYDGYDFRVYRNIPEMPGSLSDNTVISILEDSQGVLWVGTRHGGINRFDRTSGGFRTYRLEVLSEVYRDASFAVRCIYQDHIGRIWIGTNQRVYLYNSNEDRFEPMLDDAPFPVKGTTGICEDSSGYFYFATWDRLIRYHPEKGSYDELTFSPDPFADFGGRISPLLLDRNNRLWLGTPGGLRTVKIDEGFRFSSDELPGIEWPASFSYVRTIKESRDGVLWFGTQDGLYYYSPEQAALKEYKTEPYNPSSLGHNSIYSIFEDRVGTLWIGTWSGISILDKRKYEFEQYSHLHNDLGSLSNNIVSSFQEDGHGTWIGTEQGGLNFMNNDRSEFIEYQHKEDDPSSLPSNNVKTIFLDSNRDLWVGTFNGGLSLYKGNGIFDHFLEGHSVYSIVEIPAGKLYIGGRTGVYTMDLDSREISGEIFPPSSGMRNLESFTTVLHADSKNRIWIGTRNEGIVLFDAARAILKHFQSSKNDSTTISGDYIISICEDLHQNIWIGTNSGLNRYVEVFHSFERISHHLGIADCVINGLLPDDAGRLWISTNTGMYNYNPVSGELRHYDHLDGLQSNEFNRGACYRNSAGEMFFGGVAGFNVFHPEDIRMNPDAPPVIISDFKLFNESVLPGDRNSPLEKHISETSEIVLSHKQSSFSFDFVALNYLIPDKNNYAYMLEGYEKQWNESGRARTASYMNLKSGKYTFHVKGSNNDNVWNETGSSIAIEVKGPLWSTPLAILIYVVSLIGLLLALIRIVRFRTEKENELALERADKARLKELNLMRLQFFTNISHEFRTPLALITGPLDKLMSSKHEHQKDYMFGLMKSNVNRMLRLVNQLMDFRKLENEKMPLRVRPGKLDEFLSQIVLGFEDLASRKMIELKYKADGTMSEGGEQWFDEGIIDKVAYNLLSNAFKFTSEQGIIEVRLSLEGNLARIVVKDTGKGIDREKVTRIFERFYSDSPEVYAGTGIGLSLSKRLIDLHRGKIEVESEKGKGATFIVSIPVAKESFSPEELFSGKEEYVYDRPGLDSFQSSISLSESSRTNGESGRIILITEDNPEMSAYLADHFSEYKTIMAANGKEALELAKENIPDIILSDIMMPEMDGIEFCRAVKQEYLTSHIPVILLTAKAAVAEKIEGVETGADAYVEKPFDADYLAALVRNLLAQRKKLRQKFSGLSEDELKPGETGGADQVFLQKVNEIVMDHISDPAFAVDQLLLEVGMSRSQLYRKFKAISERNPSEYIRVLRLQYATKLLRKNSHTISEVAFMSGFGNVSHFNTCFKRHFGVSPGKYTSSESA
ncbi:MAG: response regulator [Bacteroidales bacterium]|nr:response regulator [Bacteroidales bacterium]